MISHITSVSFLVYCTHCFVWGREKLTVKGCDPKTGKVLGAVKILLSAMQTPIRQMRPNFRIPYLGPPNTTACTVPPGAHAHCAPHRHWPQLKQNWWDNPISQCVWLLWFQLVCDYRHTVRGRGHCPSPETKSSGEERSGEGRPSPHSTPSRRLKRVPQVFLYLKQRPLSPPTFYVRWRMAIFSSSPCRLAHFRFSISASRANMVSQSLPVYCASISWQKCPSGCTKAHHFTWKIQKLSEEGCPQTHPQCHTAPPRRLQHLNLDAFAVARTSLPFWPPHFWTPSGAHENTKSHVGII